MWRALMPGNTYIQIIWLRDSPVYLDACMRLNCLITFTPFMIDDLLESSHKLSRVSMNRLPVRFFQLLDGQYEFMCSPSPWNLRKCKVTVVNILTVLFSTVRCLVFFKLKGIFPCLKKPKPAFYLESNWVCIHCQPEISIHTAAATRVSPLIWGPCFKCAEIFWRCVVYTFEINVEQNGPQST